MPAVKDTELYRHLLGITQPWTVGRVELDAKGQRIDVHLEHRYGQRWPCPECGHSCGLHDHAEERVWRHLDSCHFLTYVRARVPRVTCREHGVRLVSVPWAEAGSRFTLLFEALAIAVLQEASVSGAAHQLGLSWDEAHGIVQRAVKRGLAARKELDLKVIGVDEKSVGQGPRFFTMVYDHLGKRVVHIADGRGKEALESFFEELEAHQLTGIRGAPRRAQVLEVTHSPRMGHQGAVARALAVPELDDGRDPLGPVVQLGDAKPLEPVKKVASMVKEHITGILAYYRHRITNALAEGTNSKIERIKNTARGYRNWDNLKASILFHCGRLELTNVSLRPV